MNAWCPKAEGPFTPGLRAHHFRPKAQTDQQALHIRGEYPYLDGDTFYINRVRPLRGIRNRDLIWDIYMHRNCPSDAMTVGDSDSDLFRGLCLGVSVIGHLEAKGTSRNYIGLSLPILALGLVIVSRCDL